MDTIRYRFFSRGAGCNKKIFKKLRCRYYEFQFFCDEIDEHTIYLLFRVCCEQYFALQNCRADVVDKQDENDFVFVVQQLHVGLYWCYAELPERHMLTSNL